MAEAPTTPTDRRADLRRQRQRAHAIAARAKKEHHADAARAAKDRLAAIDEQLRQLDIEERAAGKRSA